MNKKTPVIIEEILQTDGVYVSTTVGFSMFPMLRNRRDTIVISQFEGRLKKYDVPLYKRGDKYVLHRVIRVLPGGGYDIRGDNCFVTEKNVPEDAVIGILTEFWRDGKKVNMNSLSYKLYCRLWVALHPLIFGVKRIALLIKSVFR